jgi:hypothetical protein
MNPATSLETDSGALSLIFSARGSKANNRKMLIPASVSSNLVGFSFFISSPTCDVLLDHA